ncbi:hypothetical protein FZ025_06765 [Xanthomonas hyacinthi]|uniref:Uncharacterized protein n=1 Tax=Xanthomonas hyacinthi TaxID=56455 RepID=A0A2S7EVY1_9XANT|nr:hypothetical protein [Xanthomonas hyacinthi]KLD73764.1 hypothetical protein Y886_36180 [Xanthomonas hyacinthi DSM 19077]PPU97312.1 hypothetical protein XhyaCFBP1156_11595 [Xanthomonas hyacinthi]QGY76386.1 hypothetical protein FZ025_06765 [Xanthomonas hyacinthi]
MKIHSKTLTAPLLLALAGTLALAGCKKQEQNQNATPDPTSSAPTEALPGPADAAHTAPAAAIAGTVTVASVTVGNTAGADKTVAPLTTLASKDSIIVSVKTEGSSTNTRVGVKLLFQDGQTAGEQSATLTTAGAETTNISFTNAKGWPAGKYKAEVTVNGQPAGTPQEFEVK